MLLHCISAHYCVFSDGFSEIILGICLKLPFVFYPADRYMNIFFFPICKKPEILCITHIKS